MRKDRSTSAQEDDYPGINVSPLVDVSFLLLIYFLVASTLVKSEADLDMTVPGGRGLAADLSPMVVEIEESGRIIGNPGQYAEVLSPAGGGSNLEVLSERLRLLRAAHGSAAAVMLRVSREVDYQRFVDVINCLAGEEVTQLALTES